MLVDELNGQIKEAMKAKNKTRLDALRYLKSMLIENSTAKKPVPEMDIVISQYKKLNDSHQSYPEGSEQAVKIEAEIKIIAEFLPKQLDESEVKALIEEIAAKLENPQMGMIMKDLSPAIKGKFDGKQASTLVQNFLANK